MAREKSTARILSRRILVNIKHGTDRTCEMPKVVWMHERPILEAIWGEGNVVDVAPKTLDDGYSATPSVDMMPHNKTQDAIVRPSTTHGIDFVFVGDAQSEYERLASVYGKAMDRDILVVELIYGRFQEGKFEKLLGLPDFDDMPDEQLRQIAIEHGHLPIVSRDATAEDRKAAAAAARELQLMPRDKLLELVTNLTGALA